jgi:hypothetical protein
VLSVFSDVKLDLSVATWIPDPTEAHLDLWAITLIIENIYSFEFLKLASHGVTHVILHPMEETTFNSRFTQRSYDHLTCERSTLTLSPSQKFCLRIGSKLIDCSTWMIGWRPTHFFLAT